NQVGSSVGYIQRDNSGVGNPSSLVAAPITDGTNGTPRTGKETRPRNVGVKYIIKAWNESFNLAGFANASSNANGLVAPRKGQYNLQFSSTPAGWSLTRAVGLYYQDQDGSHRLKFNIVASVTSGTGLQATITGVTFKNIANYNPACAALSTSSSNPAAGYCLANTGTVGVNTATNQTAFCISGDVELESKPTWA
ncbi:MAG TPA: hypothetical protein V6C65_26330, partial [Allocoleopsis sp.]